MRKDSPCLAIHLELHCPSVCRLVTKFAASHKSGCTRMCPTLICDSNLFNRSDFTFSHFGIRFITLSRLDFISRQITFFLSKHQIKVSIGAFKIDCHCMKTEEHIRKFDQILAMEVIVKIKVNFFILFSYFFLWNWDWAGDMRQGRSAASACDDFFLHK